MEEEECLTVLAGLVIRTTRSQQRDEHDRAHSRESARTERHSPSEHPHRLPVLVSTARPAAANGLGDGPNDGTYQLASLAKRHLIGRAWGRTQMRQ